MIGCPATLVDLSIAAACMIAGGVAAWIARGRY